VASELGNSEKILKRHYRELFSREGAARLKDVAGAHQVGIEREGNCCSPLMRSSAWARQRNF